MRLKLLFLNLVFATICLSSDMAQGLATSSHQDMINDLEVAKYNIVLKYAPAEWKEKLFGWELENSFELAKNRILTEKPKSTKEFHAIVNEFFGSTQDYHVTALYYSTEWSMFPFLVNHAKGRYFISGIGTNLSLQSGDGIFEHDEIDSKDLVAKMKGIKIGDEIIAIDGVPIKTYIDNLIIENYNGDFSPTGHAMAYKNIFTRQGVYGQKVPKGTFKLTLKHDGENSTAVYTLSWFHVAEWVKDRVIRSQMPMKVPDFSLFPDHYPLHRDGTSLASTKSFLNKDYSVAKAKKLSSKKKNAPSKEKEKKEEEDLREKGFLPTLGEKVWETKNHSFLYAYIYKNSQGRQIGYIYLPTFSFVGDSAFNMMKELIATIKRMNAKSEALVIDINDNTGGNLLYMYAVLSLLSKTPLETFLQQEIMIQQDVYNAALMYNEIKNTDAKELLEDNSALSGYPVGKKEYNQIMNYAKKLMDYWEQGERLTPPLYVFGMDKIRPNPEAQYTKPIIVLTNEYCFSCADFFPGILQDNKRATIFGAKTAGAGGYVRRYPHLSMFGIQGYSLTASIAYRLNGEPLENLGVTPDVPYELTINDLQNDFEGYRKALDDQINLILKI